MSGKAAEEALTPARRLVLDAACDALLPALEATSGDPAEERLLTQSAADRGIDAAVADSVPGLAPHARRALYGLLDRLALEGFAHDPLDTRVSALLAAGDEVPEGRFAVRLLKAAVFGLLASRYDDDGWNRDWEAIGYPGPASSPPRREELAERLPVERYEPGSEVRLRADACVVGSGAGGSVVAARLAEAGHTVVVLESGEHHDESDFRQLELDGLQKMYLDGGLIWSEDGTLGMMAGSTLGGGTVINSMVCLRTPDYIRERWELMGLDGVAGPEFDRHTEAVWDRLGVNAEATHYNRNTQLMVAGLEARGMSHRRLERNASLDDDPRFCGYCNAGCQHGFKRSALKTYLRDAVAAGARIVVGCRAERVVTENGRAAGVEARIEGGTVRVEAPTVVVACGGIESPALLLRSGIGGPATGRYLRVHPTYMISGVYDEPVEAWSGQIQSAASLDMTRAVDGAGFLIETLTLSPAMWAGHSPFVGPRRHREELMKLPYTASWHAVSNDHGSGQVAIGEDGRPLVRWSLTGEVERRIAIRAHTELARLHEAAGAREVFTFHWHERRWRRGESLDRYLAELEAADVDEIPAFSAHQMGSCRLGADPTSSVADGSGELHDTPGVWIADAAALPTAPGVNPMISIMALARRTAERILERFTAPARPRPGAWLVT